MMSLIIRHATSLRRLLLIVLLIPGLWAVAGGSSQGQGGFPRYCLEYPENLVKNCQFNEGLNNWTPYILAGSVDISTIDGDACHTINHPCGYMRSNGGFAAGLFQQIPVLPGGIYDANLQLLLYDSFDKDDGAVGRQIGIDPTGGADPNSPNIVWSPEVWNSLAKAGHKLVWEDLKVTITAQGEVVTLFIKVNNLARVASPIHQFWIDEIGMIQIGQAEPTATPIPPTATPVPPAPTPLPPTEAPTPIPTDTPEPAPTPIPTETPTAVPPTETPTPTPTSTFTPTWTPTPTFSPTPSPTLQPSPTPTPEPAIDTFLIGGSVACLSIGGVAVVISIIGALGWLYYLGQSEEEE